MTRAAQAGANTSVCPRCGAGLRCAVAAGDAECWCARLPPVTPAGAQTKASCFCPSCLKHIADERPRAFPAAGD